MTSPINSTSSTTTSANLPFFSPRTNDQLRAESPPNNDNAVGDDEDGDDDGEDQQRLPTVPPVDPQPSAVMLEAEGISVRDFAYEFIKSESGKEGKGKGKGKGKGNEN